MRTQVRSAAQSGGRIVRMTFKRLMLTLLLIVLLVASLTTGAIIAIANVIN